MRVLALGALVLALAGCTLFTGPTDAQLERADRTGAELAALEGVTDAWASYSVGLDVGDDLRASVEPDAGTTPVQLLELVPRINAVIDDAGFNGSARTVTIELGDDSVFHYYAPRREEFDVDDEVAQYVQWWSDPRIASIDNTNLFSVVVQPGASVREVYSEIVEAGPTALTTDRTLRVADPSGYMLNADRADFAADRLDAAEEIAAIPGLTQCAFGISQPGEGPIAYLYSCYGAGELGQPVNDILDRYNQRDDTEVQLYDGEWVTTNAVP